MSILVVGSFVMDCITKTKRIPLAGESVVGISYDKFPGGKGVNQAVAARRLGSDVTMIGMVGNDSFGRTFLDILNSEKINKDGVLICDVSTGVGSITLEENGQNRIIVILGANLEYKAEYLDKHSEEFKKNNVIISQLEMRMDVVEKISKLAQNNNKTFILNPAPAKILSDDLLSRVTYLIPNETEFDYLIGKKTNSLEEKIKEAKAILNKGVENIIITLGELGSLLINKTKIYHHPARVVKVVDTVGAGDSYIGALAYALDNNLSIEKAIEIATIASSLTVQKVGAIPSLPNILEIEKLLLDT